MAVIYVKLRAIFQPNGGCIDFFFTQSGTLLNNDLIGVKKRQAEESKYEIFIFGFLCLIKPDCDKNTMF